MLEIYFEENGDRELAELAKGSLVDLVAQLAPHVSLECYVATTFSIERASFDWNGSRHEVPYHAASSRGRQTLMITREELGAEGWGWRGCCVVSSQSLIDKAKAGGNIGDILIHEWLHTICGEPINGRAVPFVDDAETMGFTGVAGADGEQTWHRWYRFALGG